MSTHARIHEYDIRLINVACTELDVDRCDENLTEAALFDE
jgi:hypothetical protein